MSSDFNPKLVRDARLNDVSQSIDYAVSQGASHNTYVSYNANTQSSSNISFNITPPSESVVVDRRALLKCKVKFMINVEGVPNANQPFRYGTRDGFKAFPLSSLFNTCTATINNTSVSVNLQDVLPSLLRQMDMEDLAYYQNMTPIALDKYKSYADAVGKNNNPLGDYSIADFNNHWLPRGCHPLDSVAIDRWATGTPYADPPDGHQNVASADDDKFKIYVEATFTEPIFISPFIFHSKYNQAGLLGVNNINLNFNIDSTLKQFWASSQAGYVTYTVTLDQATPFDAKLLLNYLSPQDTNLLPARNIVPFVDYPRYITSSGNTTAMVANTKGNKYTLNNIQLNQVPDKIFICARKALSSQDMSDSSTFFAIESASINFNNSSGLLSSATQQDLWRMSVANGSKQSWYDFSGKYGLASTVAVNGGTQYVYSEGSVLVIDPSRDLSLPSYLSNGSIGQFSLQMDITLSNNSTVDTSPEIVIIVQNTGLFATIAGSSVVRTGLLNMDVVSQLATTNQMNAISSSEHNELAGGAISDQVASALKNLPLKSKFAGARSGGVMPKSKLDMLSY